MPQSRLVTLPDDAKPERVDRALATLLPGLSRSRLKNLIEKGYLQHDDVTVTDPSFKVKAGQTFAIFLPDPVPAEPQAQAIPLEIVYEDDDLIVIDKPAGMVVHPAPGNPDGTLVNALIAHCGASLTGIGGVLRPGIVHRIDKDTSGLLVAAKTDAALAGLRAQFAGHAIERQYRAFVWGDPRPAIGRIEGNIARARYDRKKMAVSHVGGKHAVTHYRVTQRFAGLACEVECRLETGRTHQIRVHMASIGHGLLGDPVYRRQGGPDPRLAPCLAAFTRQALHAERLGFCHPARGEMLRFISPLPQDMTGLAACLAGL